MSVDTAASFLVDSHCHLDYPGLVERLPDVLAHASSAGIGLMVTICTRLGQFENTLKLIEGHDNLVCAVGLHPHNVAEEGVPTIDRLVEIARHPKVVALGETGLDYFYDNSPRDQQQESFRRHIAAARVAGVPFVVHTRNADADTAAILREGCAPDSQGRRATGLLHCFSSGRALAEEALELGLYISVSGILTFRNAQDIRDTVHDVPMDRLLVETDAPFLAPVPHRGKTNEPAFVANTAARLAELKNTSLDEMARVTTQNFYRLFTKAPAVAA